jgi:predicted MPP superfamily phosphohydrolase
MPFPGETRRKFLARALAGAGLLAAADVLLLEPRTVVAEHVPIKLTRLPQGFHGFRVAQISDIHFGP